MKILMICMGNICRSPMAEGILQSYIHQYQLPWAVDSAGTGAWHTGQPPHPESQRVCLKNKINIADQRARQFKPSDCDVFDKLLFMDQDNWEEARRMAGSKWQPAKAKLLLDYTHPPFTNVPDPYYGGPQDFEKVFTLIDQALQKMIFLETEKQPTT